MARLPQPGGDNGNWGTILNEYLSQALKSDGSIKDNAVTANNIAPNAITSSKIATDAVGATQIADGSISESLLASAVQAKLNATGGAADWTTITNKPAVIAAGADQAAARTAIGAGTSNLVIGTTGTTAKAGDYVPTKSDVGLGNVNNTADTQKPVSTAQQAALDLKASTAVVNIIQSRTNKLTTVMRGVNSAGAEFSPVASTLPGTYGTNYSYDSAESLAYYASRGYRIVRVPMRWERLQPTRNTSLDSAELGRLTTYVANAAAAGLKVVLDIHNYSAYINSSANGGATLILGSGSLPGSDLVDLWTRLSTAFKGNSGIYAYGLMNEPRNMTDAAQWETISQSIVTAIRANNDTTMIMVPGYASSSAGAWATTHPTPWITDSANNFKYEAHTYFDSDHTGTYSASFASETTTATGLGYSDLKAKAVAEFVGWPAWLAKFGVRGYLGEFGWPNDADTASWNAIGDAIYQICDANYIDVTYWAAGERWTSYKLKAYSGSPQSSLMPPATVIEAHPSGLAYPDVIGLTDALATKTLPPFIPSDQGYKAWTFDPIGVSSGNLPLAGVAYLSKIILRTTETIKNMVLYINTAGSSLTSGQNFVGLFDSSGNRLGVSADQTTAWGSSGVKSAAIVGGPLTLQPGSYFIVFIPNGSVPASLPQFGRQGALNGTLINGPVSAAKNRYSTNGTGQTSIPATITLSSNAAGNVAWWGALS